MNTEIESKIAEEQKEREKLKGQLAALTSTSKQEKVVFDQERKTMIDEIETLKIKIENEQIEKDELEKCKRDLTEALETMEKDFEEKAS